MWQQRLLHCVSSGRPRAVSPGRRNARSMAAWPCVLFRLLGSQSQRDGSQAEEAPGGARGTGDSGPPRGPESGVRPNTAAAAATATCALEHPPEARALQHHLGATGARAEKITQAKLSAAVTEILCACSVSGKSRTRAGRSKIRSGSFRTRPGSTYSATCREVPDATKQDGRPARRRWTAGPPARDGRKTAGPPARDGLTIVCCRALALNRGRGSRTTT